MSLNQDDGKGCSHLVTWLELGDLLPNGLAHMSMHWRPQLFTMWDAPWSVLTTWPFVSFGVNDSRERLTKMEAAMCFMTYNLNHTPSLLLYC